MPAKCNAFDPALFEGFDDRLTCEEEEQLSQVFEQWGFYHNLPHSRLLRCSACGEVFEAAKTGKSGMVITCPACGTELTARAAGRFGHRTAACPSLTERHNAVFLRPGPDGSVRVYAGTATAVYAVEWEDDLQYVADEYTGLGFPVRQICMDVTRHYYLAPGVVASEKRPSEMVSAWREVFWRERRAGWTLTKSAGEPFTRSSGICTTPDDGEYFLFGRDAVERSALRYSQADSLFTFEYLAGLLGRRTVRNYVSYLAWYCLRPQLEMLVKMEYRDVVDDLINGQPLGFSPDWRASNPADFFRLTKAEWRVFHRSGAQPAVLCAWPTFRGSVSMERYLEDHQLSALPRSAVRAIREAAEAARVPMTAPLRKYAGDGTVMLWVDYIRMAVQLGIDLSGRDVALPKNLRERHDSCAERIEYNNNMEELKRYRRRYKSLCRRYEFQAGGWMIRVPRYGKEIQREGNELKHCVGGYAVRHLQGQTTILFLRSEAEPDKPLCTIEMERDGETIRQIHGYRNDLNGPDPKREYAALLKPWLAWLAAGSPRGADGAPVSVERKEQTA